MITLIRVSVAAGLAVALISASDARADRSWSEAFTAGKTSFGRR